jgi:phosphopantetheinyl transferase
MNIALPSHWRTRALVILSRAGGEGPSDAPIGRSFGVSAPEDDSSWFAPDEIPTFAREKRREEWMHARIAAKELAMQKGLLADPRTCRVERTNLVIDGAASEFVSISHSHPYAAAAIDRAPVGIDVQVVRELREAAAHLFLSETEEAAMRETSLAYRLIHFWCAKEAAWKQRYGAVTTLRQLPLALVEERGHGLLFDSVETVLIGDAIVALTRPTF